MYIKKYWGNFIGGSDDSLNLVSFLEDQKKEEIALSEIFAKIGLDKQNWDFRQTVGYLEFTHSNGVEMDFHFAIDVVTDLAAIMLECSVSGSVNLQELDEYNTPSCRIRITATPEEHDAMNKALEDFAENPLSYDLHELMDDVEIQEMAQDVEAIRITATPEEHDAMNKALEDFAENPLSYDLHELMDDVEIQEMAQDVEAIRKELYETSGQNRNYHVKAEDVKQILLDWEGADGCFATNRITVEGSKVGYCYREQPDGDWDSGWKAEDVKQILLDWEGADGCFATNRITVEGSKVGYCYREQPDGDWDSGWRFTAGDESEAYMDDPNNAGIYKLNTICNDDPDIVPLLITPAPCGFERDENGVFQQIKD